MGAAASRKPTVPARSSWAWDASKHGDGSLWANYPAETAAKLEDGFLKQMRVPGEPYFVVVGGGWHVDMTRMSQLVTAEPSRRRKVRREEPPVSAAATGAGAREESRGRRAEAPRR